MTTSQWQIDQPALDQMTRKNRQEDAVRQLYTEKLLSVPTVRLQSTVALASLQISAVEVCPQTILQGESWED